MKTLFALLIPVFLFSTAQAQEIDTSELKKLQEGEYKIAEGQLQVEFNDTTTQSFVLNEMRSLDLTVKNMEFDNVILVIEDHPKKEDIFSLQQEGSVKFVINESSMLKTENGEVGQITNFDLQEIRPENISEFQIKDAYQFVFVVLENKANLKQANELTEKYADLKFNVLSEGRRAAVILTTPENEEQVISQLENKPYVKSVAYMGVLE